jgi:hypothetical protein
VIVVGAVLQSLTAAPGLGRMAAWLFVLATVGSAVVLWAQVVLLAWTTSSIARRRGLGRIPVPLLGWTAVGVAVAMAAGIVLPWLLPLVGIAALCILPAVAAGRGPGSGFAVFRRSPWRAVAAALVAIVAAIASWAVALIAGLFLTGLLGGAAMWLWFGIVGAALLLWWARLGERAVRLTV